MTEGRVCLRGSPVVLALAAFLLFAQCSDIERGEAECQEASAQLQDCCPGFDARKVECSSGTSPGCGSAAPAQFFPATFSVSDSECILESSCSDLVAKSVCARVLARTAPVPDSGADSGHPSTKPRGAVCF